MARLMACRLCTSPVSGRQAINAFADLKATSSSLDKARIASNYVNISQTRTLLQPSLSSKGKVAARYSQKVAAHELELDDYQANVISHLDALDSQLASYSPTKRSIFSKFLGNQKSEAPQGIYLYGSVGCGKTMLMDLFFENCSVTSSKKRIHFHSFMLDVHHRIHEQKLKHDPVSSSRKALSYNPIAPVARQIMDESFLLCLDEFQVTDVGDAMILKQLFAELFNNGSVVIATSNRAPDDLYKHGLQRSQFLPFIPLLKEHCLVLPLDSGVDYRQKSLPSKQKIYLVTAPSTDAELEKMFKIFASRETDTVRPKTLTIKGRNVTFEKTCGRVADCTFSELCDRPLGAVDYLAMSQLFHTVIIRNIPIMTRSKKSQARRFITMLDTFYDNKVRCLFSAAAPAKFLFNFESHSQDDLEDEHRMIMDDLGIKAGTNDAKAASSMFSGEEELFAFDRAVSRIAEMQTDDYWNKREIY